MRYSWIDSWRGLLIFFVVLGHAFGEAYHFGNMDVQRILAGGYKLIYSFHMPAFFFLAGVLWKERSRPFWCIAVKKIKRLVVPYLFWGLLSATVFWCGKSAIAKIFGDATTGAYVGKDDFIWWIPFISIFHAGGWPNGHGFQCNSVLWFLPAMFSLEIIVAALERMTHHKIVMALVAVLSLPMGFIMSRSSFDFPWGIDHVARFFPYFSMGFFFKNYSSVFKHAKKGWKLCSFGVLFVLLHIVACYTTPDPIIRKASFYWHVIFFVISLLGILASAAFSILVDCEYLREIGRSSMVIMLVHKFALIVLLNIIPILGLLKDRAACVWLFALFVASVITVEICGKTGSLLRKSMPNLIGEWR